MSTAPGDDYLLVDATALLGAADSAPARPTDPPAQWPFLLVGLVALVGLLFVAAGSLLQGLYGLVVAMSLAALLRLVLPTRTVGWLASRSRVFDAGGFAVLALGLAAATVLLVG